MPILQQAKIADVGLQTSGNPIDWTNPVSFPLVGGLDRGVPHDPVRGEEARQEALLHLYQDVPSAATNAKLAKNAAKTAGIPVVGAMVLPGATTDFAPYVQKLREAKPDVVMFINSPGVSGGLIRAATAFGLKPIWATTRARSASRRRPRSARPPRAC